jgi:protocatechuate 3,4-dioxygenase beta subunit
VNGVARELEWDALAERSSGEIKATAKTAFPFGDFAMDPPRRGPVLSLVDEIRLEIEVTARQRGSTSATCTATPQDVPANYRAGAPVRSSIGGGGYVFGGTVRSSPGCVPIGAARVELWLANPSGTYDDDHRATVVATADGRYRLDTSFPPAYGGGSSHIHIRVTAPGHRELVSIFFPSPGTTSGEMDLVMERL